MSGQDKYRSIQDSHPETIPLFHESGWLDAVCGKDHWDAVITESNDKQTYLILPYYLDTYLRQAIIRMPPLTPYLGPIIIHKTNKTPHISTSKYYNLVERIIEQLPKVKYFSQRFSPLFTDHLPFYWSGFKSDLYYTYILDLKNTGNPKNHLKSNIRNSIQRASKIITITQTESLSDLYDQSVSNYNRQNIKIPYSLNNLKRIYDYLNKTSRHALFNAIDKSGIVRASLYMAWDSQEAFNLIMTNDRQTPGVSITQLLLLHALHHAQNLGLKQFNFEGGMVKNIGSIYRRLGGIQHPYVLVQKNQNKIIDILNILRK